MTCRDLWRERGVSQHTQEMGVDPTREREGKNFNYWQREKEVFGSIYRRECATYDT